MASRSDLVASQELAELLGTMRSEQSLRPMVRWIEDRLGTGLGRPDAPAESERSHRGVLERVRIDPSSLGDAADRLVAWALASDLPSGSADLLGTLHEGLAAKRLCRGRRGGLGVEPCKAGRRKGVVYTPGYVADYIASGLLATRPAGGPASSGAGDSVDILDPACGCGAFLLAVWRQLWERFGCKKEGAARFGPAAHVWGFDVDADALLTARRSLWLEIMTATGMHGRKHSGQRRMGQRLARRLAENLRLADALSDAVVPAWAGRFDGVVGNPPYRRELGAKSLLDPAAGSLLQGVRAPRMDLWYYFLHRGLEFLKPGGRLSYIVGSYWTSGSGAKKLIGAIREGTHVEEIFDLDRLRVFPGLTGRHLILRIRKTGRRQDTVIKRPGAIDPCGAELLMTGKVPAVVFQKTPEQLFRNDRIDLEPPCDDLLAKLDRGTPLCRLGIVRQGIAENPARVTRAANRKHGNRWTVGEGVFSLEPAELARLDLSREERAIVRPYHALCDLGRYRLAAPSRRLVYSTQCTCPRIDRFPALHAHLSRFRPMMESRRETRRGRRPWWQLHWPREERLWLSPKVIALQMAPRPAFVCSMRPTYVPFSVNVFLPNEGLGEHLNYLTALLNSRLLWLWFRHSAKRRGVGLEINGHVLARAPMRTIDFSNPTDRARHDRLVDLVEEANRLAPNQQAGAAAIDDQIDRIVAQLYELSDDQIESA